MTIYYSQNGEDILLDQIFGDQKEGFFVEVGCIDGLRFSNTAAFEKRGWKGLLVEAHRDYFDLLVKNRPNSIICMCAAGEADEEDIPFYANARGSLSSLDNSRAEEFSEIYNKYFSGYETQTVTKRSLDSIFEEHGVTNIDFLSLDIEGYELQALKGMSFKRYRPRVLVIEIDSQDHHRQINSMLRAAGYVASVELSSNHFYVLSEDDDQRLRNVNIQAELLHTQHPLDNDGNRTVPVAINTYSPNFVVKSLKLARRVIKKLL